MQSEKQNAFPPRVLPLLWLPHHATPTHPHPNRTTTSTDELTWGIGLLLPPTHPPALILGPVAEFLKSVFTSERPFCQPAKRELPNTSTEPHREAKTDTAAHGSTGDGQKRNHSAKTVSKCGSELRIPYSACPHWPRGLETRQPAAPSGFPQTILPKWSRKIQQMHTARECHVYLAGIFL